jgi:hypothetical protein
MQIKKNLRYLLWLICILMIVYAGFRLLFAINGQNLERKSYQEIIIDPQDSPIQTNAYTAISKEAFDSEYDFKIIGYRIGKDRSSVILKKDNKEFVLYKGEQLANGLRLLEIKFPNAEFEYAGDFFKINLENDT